MDQVAWSNVNIVTGGASKAFKRGELLPEPADSEEAAQRQLLRIGGALRVVEVVYTADELAEQARQRGVTTAVRESALDVDGSLPLGAQVNNVAPGLPTMVDPSGSPVVIGDEDLRAEHEAARNAAAGKTAGAAASTAAAGGKTQTQTVKSAPAKPAASGPSGSAKSSSSAGSGGSSKGGAPAADADVKAWREYAATRGADTSKLASLSREDLIAAYGPPSS